MNDIYYRGPVVVACRSVFLKKIVILIKKVRYYDLNNLVDKNLIDMIFILMFFHQFNMIA